MPLGTCLNVNIPKGNLEDLKGIKVCRAAKAYWEDRFDKRLDQFGTPYYWLTGNFENHDKGEDTDLYALSKGYASVVPVHFDMTAYHAMSELNNWNWE
jgi:5'-nucleotidase